MSPPTLIDEKYTMQQQAAMAHIKRTQSLSMASASAKQKSTLKSPRKKPIATLGDHIVSPPIKDFVLFPDDAASKRCIREADAQQCEKSRPKRSESDVTAYATSRRPRRKRVPRHGGFKIVPMVETDDDDKIEDEKRQRREEIPPPAPSPPTLDSPCLSEVDEDEFWGFWKRTSGSEKPRSAA